MSYRPARERSDAERRLGSVEIVCVLVTVAAVAALIVWVVMNAGGGVLNQG